MTEANTFATLKFGIFTADDIKQRWVTNNNSKFTSLPNEVRVRWLELLRDRYLSKISSVSQGEFLRTVNSCIEKAKDGDYGFSYSHSFFSFSLSYSFFSFATFSFAAFFADEVMNELKADAKLLNDAIKEYSND